MTGEGKKNIARKINCRHTKLKKEMKLCMTNFSNFYISSSSPFLWTFCFTFRFKYQKSIFLSLSLFTQIYSSSSFLYILFVPTLVSTNDV